MATEQELVSALRQADEAGDTEGAQRIADLIKQQRAEPTEVAPVQVTAAPSPDAPMRTAGADSSPPPGFNDIVDNPVFAGVRAAGHEMFGVGDLAATGGEMLKQALHGQHVDPQAAHDAAEGTRRALAERYPASSLVGGVAGAVDGGVVGGAALKAVGVGLPAALALREGQVVKNVGRLAVAGAAAGGAQGAAQGASVGAQENGVPGAVQGAAEGGAVGAATGGVAGGVVGPVVGRAAKAFQPLNDKVARALAKTLNESAADVQRAWRTFRQATGRAPSMAEIASLKARGEIRAAAQDSPAIGEALNQRAEAAATERARSMQAQATNNAPTPASGQVRNARDASADREFDAVRQQQFPLADDELDHVQGNVLPATNLSRTARQTIAQELEQGHLSGNSALLIRRSLGRQAQTRPGEGFHELQQDVDTIIGNQPGGEAYQSAVDNYARRSANAEGVAQGEATVSQSDTPNFLADTARTSRNPDAANFIPTGARTALVTAAQTPAGATTLASRLATDDGLHQRLAATVGQDAADSLRRLGVAETGAAKNMAAVAPNTPAPASAQEAEDISRVLHTVAVASPHGSPFWKAFHLGRLVNGTNMSKAVQERVAGYLADPRMVSAGVALLRKAGVDNARLRALSLQAAETAGILGGATGAAATE